jgi:cell wall assembly regulator SMI1
MAAEIEQDWPRLTAWLAEHAPVSYATLRPPASALDRGLPEELRRLLRMNDGADASERTMATFLPGMHRPLPADQIAASNAMHVAILADLGADEDIVGRWWHPRWIMFADSGAGSGLLIDDRPGSRRGKVSEWDRIDGPILDLAPSLSEFIADVADALEARAPLHGWRPVVADGNLEWVPADDSGLVPSGNQGD